MTPIVFALTMDFVLTIVVLVLRNALGSDYVDRPAENGLKRNVVGDATIWR